jgi:hypothetical protein
VCVKLCDAETQQLVGVCLSWATERQDKRGEVFNFLRNLHLTTQLI